MAYGESNGHMTLSDTEYLENGWKQQSLIDSLLWGSTVGSPSDNLASCLQVVRLSKILPTVKNILYM